MHRQKVVIAGSRSIQDFAAVRVKLDRIFKWLNIVPMEIVSGCADGADKAGESYAVLNNIDLVKMPADWNKHGKKAGVLRNLDMANYCDMAVVFWDGKSPGTKNMISNMSKLNKPCIVIIMES